MTSEAASYISEYFCRNGEHEERFEVEEEEEGINKDQEVLWRVCRGTEAVTTLSRLDTFDIEAPEPESGWRPLHLAVGIYGNAALTTMLLVEMGADPNARTTETTGRRSPLHLAAFCGHYQCCQVLLKHNARSGARTADGQTALHLAAQCDSFDTIKLIARASPDIDSRDDFGRTPLHLACSSLISAEAIQFLLESGANPHATDTQARTPLDVLKKVVEGTHTTRTKDTQATAIAKLLGGSLDDVLLPTDLISSENTRHQDDTDEELFILITKENIPRMLETAERKVALFTSGRAALGWHQTQILTKKISEIHVIPARVAHVQALRTKIPTELILFSQDEDEHDDPLMADFVQKATAEKQAEEQTSELRHAVKQKQEQFDTLKNQISETSGKAQNCNAKILSLNEECARLHQVTTALHAELSSSQHGSEIVDAALDLAASGHPAASTNDPKRLATAAAHHLAYKRRLAILLSKADAAVAAASLADAKLEAQVQAQRLFELQEAEEERQRNLKKQQLLQKEEEERKALEQKRILSSRLMVDPPKSPAPAVRTVEVLDDSDEDSSSEDDALNLQELEMQLKAAGVRKHAKVAKHLNDQELSWTQMIAVYRKGGSDAIHRTLLPLGLKAGAISAIDLHLSACSTTAPAPATSQQLPASSSSIEATPSSQDEEEEATKRRIIDKKAEDDDEEGQESSVLGTATAAISDE